MEVSRDIIQSRLISVVATFLQIARQKEVSEKVHITEKTDLYEDLGVDSLEAMDLVNKIENEFKVSIDAQELMARRTIEDIADYISEKRNS